MSDKTGLEIIVKAEHNKETGRTDFFILLPREQRTINIKEATHLLLGGVSMLIKSCSQSDFGIKDFELLKEAFDHLKHEFSSIDSFEDSKADESLIKKYNKTEDINSFLSGMLDELKSKQTENKGGGIRPIDYDINCIKRTLELISNNK